mgnify:CR=1 FL=1
MACESGCVTSVDIMIPDSVFGRCLRIQQYNGDRIYLPTFQLSVPPITSTFENRKYEQPKVDAQAVRAEMDACFKDTDAITLNCGACGYPGCDGYAAAVADGKAKAFTVRTLCPDLAHIRLVERPQRVEDVLRLRALIVARTEGVDDVPVEEPRELVKADDAGLLALSLIHI